MRSADGPDLTGRAAIRNAALRLFADRGPDAVSVREIAAAAGVSPALVLHHFGSKAGLHEAVDRHVTDRLHALLQEDDPSAAEVMATGSAGSIAEVFARVFPPTEPVADYVRRLLLSADPAGTALFREWFAVSQQMLDQMVASGLARPSADPEVRAAFMLAADVALLVLRGPLTDALGFDPMSGHGLERWAGEVAVITRDGVFGVAPAAPRPVAPEDAATPPTDRTER